MENTKEEDPISKNIWKNIVKFYDFIEGAQISNSFVILKVLYDSEDPLSTTQISQKISSHSDGKLFKVSGVLKDTLENRLRKLGYVNGEDIANINSPKKPIKLTLYSITPKGNKLLKGWISFLKAFD
ncbi:PadR family transcriptional regulator [Candidatus Nitrosocosmicus sp. T]